MKEASKTNATTVGVNALKSANGITLIALIITIIVMLILAGIVLNLTIGDRGIFKIAQIAGDNYTNAQEKELYELNELDKQFLQNPTTNDEIESKKILSYKIKNNNNNLTEKTYTQLTDLTGNQNDAILNATVLTDDKKGLTFNGTSSYAQLDLKQELTFPMTVELNLSTTNSKTSIIYLEPNSGTALAISSNNYFTCTINQKTNTFKIPDDFFNGEVKNIIIEYTSLIDVKMFVDEIELTKNSSKSALDTGIGSIPYLGRRQSGNYFNGTIYEFKIYNGILSENQAELMLSYNIEHDNNYRQAFQQLKDCTNNKNDATCTDIISNEKCDGILFNGTTSFAQIELKQELKFPMTVELILSTTRNKTSIIYIEPNSKIALAIGDNGSYFSCTVDNKTNTFQIPENFFDGTLKHIVMQYNSQTDVNVYINNEELNKNSFESALTQGAGDIPYIGRRKSGDYFEGTLYEFNIYKDIFTKEEITKQ